jgi:AAHS family 4-hydroxybenzoate transporter-like MFS transporter
MLAAQGLNVATASSGLAAYNFGGVLGVLIISLVVTTLGSRRPLLWGAVAGSVSALLLELVHITPGGSHTILIAGIGLHGLFVNAVQTTMYALASHVYPTRVRATGIACAAAVGRVGGLVGSLGGAMIIQAGSGFFLLYLAIAMAGTFVGIAIVRNHYPGRRQVTAG